MTKEEENTRGTRQDEEEDERKTMKSTPLY
jgi:hypothetical protein